MGRKGMVLKPEYQDVADDFFFTARNNGCSCHICPPCWYCTHEGNPANLEENDDAWESELIGAIRDAKAPNDGLGTAQTKGINMEQQELEEALEDAFISGE